MGIPVEASEAEVKQRIRAYFAKVKPEHRQQVIERLQQLRTNDERLSYLRGWTKLS
jgi:hypothetical protein